MKKIKNNKNDKKNKRQSFLVKIFFISLFIFVLSFVVAFAFLVSFSSQKMGDLVQTSNFINPITSKVYDINGQLITEFFQENRTPISLSTATSGIMKARSEETFDAEWGNSIMRLRLDIKVNSCRRLFVSLCIPCVVPISYKPDCAFKNTLPPRRFSV